MRLKRLIIFIVVIILLTTVLVMCYPINNTVIKENNEMIDLKENGVIEINNDEIVASGFQIEYNEELNKWQVFFTVEKKSVEDAENYDDYFIYFSDNEEKLLGYTYATMFNGLKEGINNCVVNVDFDATLISKIVIKKKM